MILFLKINNRTVVPLVYFFASLLLLGFIYQESRRYRYNAAVPILFQKIFFFRNLGILIFRFTTLETLQTLLTVRKAVSRLS